MPAPTRITKPLVAVLTELLAADDRELHGWVIKERTGKPSSTVYRILERLTELGWLTTRWAASPKPNRPSRCYYRLTPLGETRAREILASRAPDSAVRR
jgi:DNA-binding PadR family transcriptional regulator